MYPVTEAYKKALLKEYIEDSISGTVTLADGTVIDISDEMLVRGSLKITHELCREYKIGTFNLGCLQISFFDSDALLHDFSGAQIRPVYNIKTEDGTESVPMGIYTADGGSVRRKRDTISLTAYDRGILFDRVIPDELRETEGTPPELISLACADCGVPLAGIDGGLPNSGVRLVLSGKQVQTYRDLAAWCASVMCGYAVIDREGRLRIISAKYSVSGEDSSVIIIDKYLTEKERDSIYVTDTRAYIKTLNAYCAGTLKTYVSDVVQEDGQAAAAVYRLPKNPLIPAGLDDEEYDAINTSWLSYIDGFKQRGVTAKIYGDPAIDAGDVLRCSGGDIDQRKSIVGLVTKQEWRYRAFHTVICAAPVIYGRTPENTDVVVDQLEKKINGALYTAGNGIVMDNGGKVEANIGSGLDFDDDGKIICTAAGGSAEHYFGTFTLRDKLSFAENGGQIRLPLAETRRKPMLVIVTENIPVSYNSADADYLRHNVWVSGIGMNDPASETGWIGIDSYPNGRWFVNFGIQYAGLTPAQQQAVFNEWKNRRYNFVVICE